MKKHQSFKPHKIFKPRKYMLGILATSIVLVPPLALSLSSKQSNKKIENLAQAKYEVQVAEQTQVAKETIDFSLSQNNFSFTGKNGEGQVALENLGTNLEHLEIYYTLNLASVEAWNKVAPTNLSNGQIFYARLAVKEADNERYVIAPNTIAVKVSGLELETIQNPIDNIKNSGDFSKTKLDQTFFNFAGANNKGSVYLNQKGIEALSSALVKTENNNKTVVHKSPGFDERLEAQFSKDNVSWTSHVYDLSNDQKIYARIGVKKEFENVLSVNETVKTGDAPDIYTPVQLEVKNLWTDLSSHRNEQIDFTQVRFTGTNGAGSASYEGFNKDEYKDGLTFTKTTSFMSAYNSAGLKLVNEDNIYQSKSAQGQFEFNTRYLYPLNPLPDGQETSTSNTMGLKASEPFIVQNKTPIKEAIINYETLDGRGFSSEVPPDDFFKFRGRIKLNATMTIKFNDDGSFASGRRSDSSFDQPVEEIENKHFIFASGIGPTSAGLYNYGYLYVDAQGNVGIGLRTNGTDGHNGMAAIASIVKVTYQDNSVWDTRVDNQINNDLANNQWVSVMPTNKVDGILTDVAKKGVSVKVNGLLDQTLTYLPPLENSFFEINKTTKSLTIKPNTTLETNAKFINLLYSTDGINFSPNLPTGLKDKDVVLIQQTLKPGQKQLAISSPRLARFVVSGQTTSLDKVVLPDVIKGEYFNISMSGDQAKVLLNPTAPFSSQVEVEWRAQDKEWSTTPLEKLKDNEEIFARLKVKDEFASSYALGQNDGYETRMKVHFNSGSPTLEIINKVNTISLSGAAIFGIVVGVLVLVGLLTFGILYVLAHFFKLSGLKKLDDFIERLKNIVRSGKK